MKGYQKLFIGLSLLVFISCGSSGGGGHDSPKNVTSTPPKEEVIPPKETTPPKEEVIPPKETTPPKEEVIPPKETTPPKEDLTPPVNGEVLKKGETSTSPMIAKKGEIQTSNGDTNINDKTKVAMTAENGGQITNGIDGTISGVFAVGIEASGTGSKVINDGKVIGGSNEKTTRSLALNSNEDINEIGMKAFNGGEAVNNGEISGKLALGILVDGKDSNVINNGKVSSTGVKYTETYIDKNGIKYSETGVSATGIEGSNGASVINGEDGSISGTIGNGISVEGEGSTAINNGNISSTGSQYHETYIEDEIEHNGTGIYATGMKAANGAFVINGTGGVISGTIDQGMKAEGEGSTAINDGEISSTGAEYTDTYDDKDGIQHTTSGTSAKGMRAKKGASITNNGTISGTLSEGMKAEGGSSAINNGSISSTGVEETQTYTDENGITHIKSNAYPRGMRAKEGASVTNNGNISGTIGQGMRAEGEGSTAVNSGAISSTGTTYSNTTNEDDRLINVSSGTTGTGMSASEGAKIINKATGVISGTLETGMEAEGEGSAAINDGNISSTGTEWTNSYTDKAGIKVTNSGTQGHGMRAKEGASVTNNGNISGTLSEGMKADGESSRAVNNGKINFIGIQETYTHTDETGITHTSIYTDAVGMEASDGASILNEKTGTISGTLGKGMKAEGEGSTAINNGEINYIGAQNTHTSTDENGITHTSTYTNAIGMEASDGASILNEKTGTILGTLSEGMKAEGASSIATNNGKINFINGAKKGMSAEYGGKIINNGNITGKMGIGMEIKEGGITGVNNGLINIQYLASTLNLYNYSTGMYAHDGIITNGATGIITGALESGMVGTGINMGVISIEQISDKIPSYLKVSGMKAYDGTIKNSGIIDMYAENGIGMYALNGTTAINEKGGIINLNNTNGIGMYAQSMIYNEDGEINVSMSILENSGTININDQNGTGMYVRGGSTSINEKNSIINLNRINGIGMYAQGRVYYENGEPTGIKSTSENYGTININSQNGTGMKALDGATAINTETGIINLNNSNGIGMYATGEGSTIENRGEIYLSGSEVTSSRDSQTAEDIATNGEMINGKDSKGNIGMKIENKARMINKGHITFGK